MSRVTICLVLVSFLISCDNELNLLAPEKDVPVIYGLLTPSDTAQYIRVERAFIDENTSAAQLASDPNNLYYPNASVSIVRNSNGDRFNLAEVDGNLEGFVREEGAFAQTPNTLYKIKSDEINLVEGEQYTLELLRSETSDLITAQTTIVEAPFLLRPTPTSRIDFDFIDNFIVTWRANEGATIFDVLLEIEYQEVVEGVGAENKILTWTMGKNIEGEELLIPGVSFYTFISGALEADPGIIRVLQGLNVKIIAGGQEILDLVRIGQANLGISSSQEIPIFTNVSNGLGIFSSRSVASRVGLSATPRTLDSLRNSTITEDLNFR